MDVDLVASWTPPCLIFRCPLKGVNFKDDFFTWFLQGNARASGIDFLRRLAGTLQRFDFSRVSQDVLKELYQEIVEREARHDIGEYYTPDWLAEEILRTQVGLPERPSATMLDPSCGSGTFLFIAIRLVKEALRAEGRSDQQVLDHILDSIQGVDIHPVAVTTARTNYLLALEDLLPGRKSPISIPVYHADSLLPPERPSSSQAVVSRRVRRARSAGQLGEPVLVWQAEQEANTQRGRHPRLVFEFPDSILSSPQTLDVLVNNMHAHLKGLQQGDRTQAIDTAVEGYKSQLGRISAASSLSPESQDRMVEMFRLVAQQFVQGTDTVWLFLLKNMPRPVFLARRQFDVVVGNPPWLSLRYFRGASYAARVKRLALEDYSLQPRRQTHLATQMELATLFFARAVDRYLKPGGTIAFVMPRSVMVAQQHERFNTFSFKGGSLQAKLRCIMDVERVRPLFNVPACVLVAEKGRSTAWPVPCHAYEGTLDGRNLPWTRAMPRLKQAASQVERAAGKLLPQGQSGALQAALRGGPSYYHDLFAQGATIVPRTFWFVRPVEGPLGHNPAAPLVETDREETRQAKAPWRDAFMHAQVESDFLYATLPSANLLPFGYTALTPVVLPLLREGPRYTLLDVDGAQQRGYPHLAAWLRETQRHWEAHAARDRRGQPKIQRAIGRLDFRHGLTNQSPGARYRVLYNAAGTNLLGCVIDTDEPTGQEGMLRFRGFLAEHKTYVYETEDDCDAFYLASVFNSAALDDVLKPMQTRGLGGERDIEKRPLRFAIPRYDSNDATHRRLADIGRACHARVAQVGAQLGQRYRGSARRRASARDLLSPELAEIDRLVKRLLGL